MGIFEQRNFEFAVVLIFVLVVIATKQSKTVSKPKTSYDTIPPHLGNVCTQQ